MAWRLEQWILSISSSSPSSSRISDCTAGSPQLFMHDVGGWIFKSLLKVEVKQQADCAGWVQRAVKWDTPSLNGIMSRESKDISKGRHLWLCSQKHKFRFFAYSFPGLSDCCTRLRTRPCGFVKGQSCWLRACSAFQCTPQGGDSTPEIGHTLVKGRWHMAQCIDATCTVNALRKNDQVNFSRRGTAAAWQRAGVIRL